MIISMKNNENYTKFRCFFAVMIIAYKLNSVFYVQNTKYNRNHLRFISRQIKYKQTVAHKRKSWYNMSKAE